MGPGGRGPTARTGNLRVVTTNLRPGYVRKNGAPYSAKTTVTEFYDLNTLPNGDQWITITTKVDDPVYFARTYVTTTDFKKLPGPVGWNPTPCSAR
jgi:ligand-binding SRPBCC domain-containing protein